MMSQHDIEIQKLSKNLKIRNKVLNKLLWLLYHKQIKLHNKSEERIWETILGMDKERQLFAKKGKGDRK